MEQELPAKIASLLLPVSGMSWLLPGAAVAEVIALRQPDRLGRGADWMLGWLSWRGQSVPLISVERLNARGQGSISQTACIGIFHNGRNQPRYFAVILQAPPEPVEVAMEMLEERAGEACGPAEAMCVRLEDQAAVIPNLDYIAKALADLRLL